MEEWFRARLLAAAAITALAVRRVDWGMRQQGAPLPAVSMNVITSLPEVGMAGPTGWTDARIQIDCWGETFGAAKSLREAVYAVVHCLRATDSNGRKYRGFVLDSSSNPEPNGAAVEHRAQLDLRLSYQS